MGTRSLAGKPVLSWREHRLSILVLLLALTATSCSIIDSSGGRQVDSDTPVRDFFYATEESELEAFRIQQFFVADCMSTAGWEYTPESVETVYGENFEFVDVETSRSREYRELYGLAFDPSFRLETPEEQELIYTDNTKVISNLSIDARALWIEQEQACYEESSSSARDLVFVLGLDEDVQEEIFAIQNLTHPQILDEVDVWSRCLAEEGFPDISDPTEMYGYANALYDDPEYVEGLAHPEDIELALADLACGEALWTAADSLIDDLESRVADQAIFGQ